MLRLTNLDLKPASSIEIATIGYSLGHGFNQIPLNQGISLETLLAPLTVDPNIGYREVLDRLIEESTHPPLYFWLTHWWLNLWLKSGDLVSLAIARSLSALFGILAIPASFILGWVTFRSRLIAHLGAMLMAISPYGIYLAQEARHYTLSVLWVIASLVCLVETIKLIEQKARVPVWLGLVWIVINALAIATHYFFILTLGASAIAIVVFWLLNRCEQPLSYLRNFALPAIGTCVSALVWLPIIRGISDNQMTTWIATSYELSDIWLPLPRLVAWIITMVMLLPIEGTSQVITIGSGAIVLAVLIGVIPTLLKQWRLAFDNPQTGSAMTILSGYLFGSLIMFLLVIYILDKDLSLAARYHFVYFPGLILFVAIALAGEAIAAKPGLPLLSFRLNTIVAIFLIMGLLGSITVITNLGFQKSRHSDRLAAHIQQNSSVPTIVAMTHTTHSEIRELIALAVSFKRLNTELVQSPQFLLVSHDQAAAVIAASLATTRKTSELANIAAINLDLNDESLEELGCNLDKNVDLADSGYRDRFYRCSIL